MKEKLTGKQAIGAIAGSVVIVLCLVYGSLFFYRTIQEKRASDGRYIIQAIVQKSRSNEVMETQHLAELLGLSSDEPTNVYAFDTKEAERILHGYGCFKKIKIRTIAPAILSVDYELRQPVAIVTDYENRAMDRVGHLFPLLPFFTMKSLPEFYLGTNDRAHRLLAFEVFDFACESPCEIKRIDVSQAFSRSATREIVVSMKYEGREFLLRLPVVSFRERIMDFFRLIAQLHQLRVSSYPHVVDLRVEQLALMK